jgi:integrase
MSNTIVLRKNKLVLYKRTRSGMWQCRYKLGNGEWYRQTTGTDEQEEAEDIAFKLYYGADEREKNKLPQNTRKFKHVARYAIQRMQDDIDAGAGKVVYKDYIRVINNYLIPYFGNLKTDSITTRKVIEYSAWRDRKMGAAKEEKKRQSLLNQLKSEAAVEAELERNRKTFKPAQSTLNTHNSALNRVLDEALLRGWITESIRPEVMNKGVKAESRDAFTLDEYQQIYRGLRQWTGTGHRKKTQEIREVLREYVLFLANTGIRHGTEALSIKWSNVRYYTSLIDAQRYLEVAVDGKVGKRSLIARDNALKYLERLKNLNEQIAHLTLDELFDKKLDISVFQTRSGDSVTTDTMRGSFRQFLNHIGISKSLSGKGLSLYSLRHMYATFALASGISIYELSLQMGTSVKMLEDYYSKISPQMNAAIHSGRLARIKKEQIED